MHVRQIVLGIVLGGLVSSPEFARVQGRRHEMGMQDGRGSESDSMPQMRGLMEPLSAQSTAGPRTLDEPLPRHTMMVQLVGRMATLGCGTRGSDTATPLAGMRARLGAPPPEEP